MKDSFYSGIVLYFCTMKNGDTAYIDPNLKTSLGLKYFTGYTGYIKELNPQDGSFLLDFDEYNGVDYVLKPRTNLRVTREIVGKNYLYLTVNSQDTEGYNPYEYKHIFDKSIWGKIKSIILWLKEIALSD